MLSALDSPLATGRENFTIPDLLVAVKCCRARHGKYVNMRPNWLDIAWGIIYRAFPSLFRKHAVTLFQWVGIQGSAPKFYRTGGSSKREHFKVDRAPVSLGLACSLMSRAGFSRHEAWDTPIGEARWIDAQMAKLDGAPIHFLNDEDMEEAADPFDSMTNEEVYAEMSKVMPSHILQATFEKWKQEKGR